MSNDAIISIAATAGMVLFFLIMFLPDIIKNWQSSKAEITRASAEANNAALKREMVEKGFSADEITRVINAGSTCAEKTAIPAEPH